MGGARLWRGWGRGMRGPAPFVAVMAAQLLLRVLTCVPDNDGPACQLMLQPCTAPKLRAEGCAARHAMQRGPGAGGHACAHSAARAQLPPPRARCERCRVPRLPTGRPTPRCTMCGRPWASLTPGSEFASLPRVAGSSAACEPRPGEGGTPDVGQRGGRLPAALSSVGHLG